jgi:KaiC/GvpD/RAD55 family RecA-like ATPase
MRTNTVTLIVGDRGTGKTTFLKGSKIDRVTGVIDVYLRQNPKKKILVVDIFNNSAWAEVPVMERRTLPAWKKGVYRIYDADLDALMSSIEKSVANAVIIFEDATKYIGAKLNRHMYRFLIDSKQKNLDVLFVFHSLAACPLDLVRIANFIILFKTKEQMNATLRGKFPFPEIPMAFERVQNCDNRYFHESIALD